MGISKEFANAFYPIYIFKMIDWEKNKKVISKNHIKPWVEIFKIYSTQMNYKLF